MDSTIRDQGYVYFLSEAPELLQTVEDGLLQLHDAPRVQNIHSLMRATHTLKGAAANVGLKTIETIAHSLEDAFKALYNEDIEIDTELERLLFEGYECLRVPLSAELSDTPIDENEVLDRAAELVTQFEAKLGADFGQQDYIPSSAELGFDIAQSIFELGVKERIEALSGLIAAADETAIETELRSTSEVFIGLGESLGLAGWSSIASTVLAALDLNPDRILEVATLALADYQAGQALVLNGDRESGGQASPALARFASQAIAADPPIPASPEARSAIGLQPLDLVDSGEFGESSDRGGQLDRVDRVDRGEFADLADDSGLDFVEFSSQLEDLDDEFDEEDEATFVTASGLELALEKLSGFLIDSHYGKPVNLAIRDFFLKLVRVAAHWYQREEALPTQNFSLDLLVPRLPEEQLTNKKAALTVAKTVRDWGDRFLETFAAAHDSESLRMYRKWTLLSALVVIAKCQYAECTEFPKAFKDVLAVVALRQLAQNVGDRYQQLPAISKTQMQWLDTPVVDALLKSRPPAKQISSDDLLLEEVWGGEDLDEWDASSGGSSGSSSGGLSGDSIHDRANDPSGNQNDPSGNQFDRQPDDRSDDPLGNQSDHLSSDRWDTVPIDSSEHSDPEHQTQVISEVINARDEALLSAIPAATEQAPRSGLTVPTIAPITTAIAPSDVTSPPATRPVSTPVTSPRTVTATVTSSEAVISEPHSVSTSISTTSGTISGTTSATVTTVATTSRDRLEPHVNQAEFVESTPSDKGDKADDKGVTRKKTETRQLVSVDLAGLERLNHRLGELLIEQNRLTLDEEQLFEATKAVRSQIQRHQKTMTQLLDWSEQIMSLMERAGASFEGKEQNAGLALSALANLEMLDFDGYADLHLLLKTAAQESALIESTTDEIGNLVRGSGQAMEKQRQLLSVMQDDLVDVRMLPLKEIFDRFPLVLRQLSRMQGKTVNLEISGADLAIEQGVVQKLYEPLLHLVRNAFDHGIEDVDTRRSLGKPDIGTIEIRAYNQGTQTTIEVRDDGRGLNIESIRRKAVEKNFLTPEQAKQLISSDRLDILFEPGFSTAAKVNEISGRGVGLDVVRTQIQNLKGSISVQSEGGIGTMFSLRIPLSLTIAKLLVVQAGGSAYAVLLDAIEKIVMPLPGQTKLFENNKVLQMGDESEKTMVSVRQLADLMHYTSSLVSQAAEPTKGAMSISRDVSAPILLLRYGNKHLGLEVDHIIGEQELVIRPLGGAIKPPGYVYGCSILSDSRLCLVIDGGEMIDRALMPTAMRAAWGSGLTLNVPNLPPRSNLSISASPSTTSTAAPFCVLPSAAEASSPTTSIPQVDDDHHDKTVLLIVDDSINLRHTLSLTLQKAGYHVIQARDGQEALEQLEAHDEVALVLCDVEMPRMNGFEFLSQSRQHPELAKVPVVTLTSHSSQKYRQIASSLGASGYLTKPYSESELLSTVEDLLGSINESNASSI